MITIEDVADLRVAVDGVAVEENAEPGGGAIVRVTDRRSEILSFDADGQ
jgi:hypothetical protein